MSRIKYQKGEKIGDCIYIKDTKTRICSSGSRSRMAEFECCLCGNKFEATIDHVKRKNIKSCGCLVGTYHGLSGNPLYFTWNHAIQRCTVKTDPNYKYYGARGIKMCNEWMNDVNEFIKYIESLPKPDSGDKKLTLDRINNDGDYEPGNVRWATYRTQVLNRRKFPGITGYTGVNKVNNRFRSVVFYNYQNIHLGYFDSAEEANSVRLKYIADNNLNDT